MGTSPGVKETYSAIDVGSNAIRMAIAERDGQEMKIIKKFRLPIRLGGDVFENGKISTKILKIAARTFEKFREVSDEHNVRRIRAVGTSALREASNQKQFLELIRRKSGIRIDVIDGVEEAKIIHLAVKKELHLENHRALLIDIGGGSVEFTFSESAMMTATQSFPFGTVRMLQILKKRKTNEAGLQALVSEFSEPLSLFLRSHVAKKVEFAIGTGGNMETLGKLKPLLLKKQARTFILATELEEMLEIIRRTPMKERMEKWDLRPDRADVILPACTLVHTALTLAKVPKLVIPYVGLKDGLLWQLANQN